MGLIDLKTDLTSLRYGSDTKGGGESRSAKFMNNIYSPETTGVDQSFDQPSQNPQSSGDFVLRGGILYPNRVTNDFQRIGNFMASWKGVNFIAKQNVLARQQSKVPVGQLPTRIYSPFNTLAEVAGGSNSTGLHLDGKGFIPDIPEETKYNKQTFKQDIGINRLNQLYTSKIEKEPIGPISIYGVTGNQATTTLLQYSGGPNASIPGVSNSTYQRVSNTTLNGQNTYNPSNELGEGYFPSYLENIPGVDKYKYISNNDNRLVLLYKTKLTGLEPDPSAELSRFNLIAGRGGTNDLALIYLPPTSPKTGKPGTSTIKRVTNTSYKDQLEKHKKTIDSAGFYTFNQELIEKQPTKDGISTITDFRQDIKDAVGEVYPENPKLGQKLPSTNYEEFNRKKTYGEGNPGKRNFDRSDPYGEGFQTGWEDTVDKVNYQRLYAGATANKDVSNLDIIPFYITALDNDASKDNVHIHFRAFIDSFSDNYNATWDSHKFMGRGENFYTYDGFSREINLSFKIHAQSKPELKAMYSKLNYLASTLAPDYNTSKGGFMRGNLVKLTMGDYLTDTIGFISALSYTIPQESVWDIARNADGTKSKKDLALPHLIEVSSFNFTPITSFLPQKVSSNYIRKQTSKNMNAPFISLKNKEGYENTNPLIPQNAPDPGDGNVSIEEEWDWDESEQEWNWIST